MDVFRNQAGTTKPTFRIGAKGIDLISKAIIDTNLDSQVLLSLKKRTNEVDVLTSNLSERDSHNINEIDPEALYDSDLPKSELVSYSINKQEGVIVLWVKDGYVKLPLSVDLSTIQDANKDSVIGPDSAVIGNVPLFATSNGKRIKDSGLGVITSIREKTAEELEADGETDGTGRPDNLVTENAILEYVGIPKNRLKARLEGNLENDDPYANL